MKRYIGVKLINAKPMTRQVYNDFRGWALPVDEDGTDEGYLVEYLDGGQANTKAYEGYVSWSPKEVFERAYEPTDGMSFGLAIEALQLGLKVARKGWNGKGMWLKYIPEGDACVSEAGVYPVLPWIGMKTADDKFVPWLASQTDVLANDWNIV